MITFNFHDNPSTTSDELNNFITFLNQLYSAHIRHQVPITTSSQTHERIVEPSVDSQQVLRQLFKAAQSSYRHDP